MPRRCIWGWQMLLSPLQVNEFVASRSHGNVLFRMVGRRGGQTSCQAPEGADDGGVCGAGKGIRFEMDVSTCEVS